MSDPKTVFVVEDEPDLATLIADYLVDAGMEPTILGDGHDAVERILGEKPDLVILDIMLPGKDGISICREVRAQSDVPIILETAKAEEIDRLLGLELGADDYVCKPFSPRELIARVKAVLRRSERTSDAPFGEQTPPRLIVDDEKWRATLDGKPLDLTRREFQLLRIFVRRPGHVYSRSQLLDLAFSDDGDVFDRTVDSHIKNLRRKMNNAAADFEPVRSVYGVGYAFDL